MAKGPITTFPVDDLEPLTEAQMKFCQGIWKGLSASKAYRAAYDCSEQGESTILASSSRLRNNPAVAQWINAGYAAHLGSGKLTIEEHLDELTRLKTLALANGNVSAAVQAETVRGKAAGLHIDRIMDLTEADPMALLAEIAKFNPQYAEQLRKEAGLPGTMIQ